MERSSGNFEESNKDKSKRNEEVGNTTFSNRRSAVLFGESSQIGDPSFRDVAAGNIYNLIGPMAGGEVLPEDPLLLAEMAFGATKRLEQIVNDALKGKDYFRAKLFLSLFLKSHPHNDNAIKLQAKAYSQIVHAYTNTGEPEQAIIEANEFFNYEVSREQSLFSVFEDTDQIRKEIVNQLYRYPLQYNSDHYEINTNEEVYLDARIGEYEVKRATLGRQGFVGHDTYQLNARVLALRARALYELGFCMAAEKDIRLAKTNSRRNDEALHAYIAEIETAINNRNIQRAEIEKTRLNTQQVLLKEKLRQERVLLWHSRGTMFFGITGGLVGILVSERSSTFLLSLDTSLTYTVLICLAISLVGAFFIDPRHLLRNMSTAFLSIMLLTFISLTFSLTFIQTVFQQF